VVDRHRVSRAPGIVVVAMEEEAEPFLQRASRVSDEVEVGGASHRSLTVDDIEILLVRSGIGLVNAAGAAAAAIVLAERSGAPAPVVLSAGTAGGTGPRIRVGDVVVGAEYVNLDADARVFGYVYGQVPRMPASYLGDDRLLRSSLAFAPEGGGWRTHAGLIASSYSFMTPEKVERGMAFFPAIVATDMESVALAQTCHVHGVPFLSVRGISDLAGPDGANDHDSNALLASEHSADVTLHLLRLAAA
jgi:adenosylhomocysteine nucleosidase